MQDGPSDMVFDLNLSDSDDDEPQPTMNVRPVSPYVASKKRRVLHEWDKLTVPYIADAAEKPHTNVRAARQKHTGRKWETEESKPMQTSPKRKAAAGKPVRKAVTHLAWALGERCEAKFRAKEVGSHNAFWFAGMVERVSSSGKRCDVAYDDGDREADVPLRYLRLPSTPLTTDVVGDKTARDESPPTLPSSPTAELSIATEGESNSAPTAATSESPMQTPDAPPARRDEESTSPTSTLRQTMVDLLSKDLSRFGLSNNDCAAIVDAIKCCRSRFRSVRFNLRQRNAVVAKAFARGVVALESIADLSAFSQERPDVAPQAPTEPVAEPTYRYRQGMWLPMVVEID